MSTIQNSVICAGRITVDLSLFFQDYKKYCVVYLDYKKMKTVQDLKCHITDTFNLKHQFIIMLEDCLVLENDDLNVLRNGDHIWLADPENFVSVESGSSKQTLKQVPAQDNISNLRNLSGSNSILPKCTNNGLNGHSEEIHNCEKEKYPTKRKHTTEGYVANAANKQDEIEIGNYSKKKKKQFSKPNADESEDENDSMPLVEETLSAGLKTNTDFLVQNNLCANKTKLIALKSCVESVERENGKEDKEVEIDWNSVPLPKRKRIRKRRSKKSTIKLSTVSLSDELPQQSTTCVNLVLPAIKQQAGRVHIRFDEKKIHEDEIPNCAKMQTDDTYSMKNIQPKVVTPSKTDHNDKKSLDLSQLFNVKKPIIFERKREPIMQETHIVQTKAQINTWETVSDEEIWKCPTITEAPKKNDFVAFKVLHLSADYSPQLSPWIIASVTSDQSADTEKLVLDIQRGSNPFYRDTTGKFEVEETEDEQNEVSMQINWQEMITPRNITNLK